MQTGYGVMVDVPSGTQCIIVSGKPHDRGRLHAGLGSSSGRVRLMPCQAQIDNARSLVHGIANRLITAVVCRIHPRPKPRAA